MYASLLKRLEKRRADRYRRTSMSSREREVGGLYPAVQEALIVEAERLWDSRCHPCLVEYHIKMHQSFPASPKHLIYICNLGYGDMYAIHCSQNDYPVTDGEQ